VHTSTATVAVMPEVDEVEVKVDDKDIVMTTARSGGAGTSVTGGNSLRYSSVKPGFCT